MSEKENKAESVAAFDFDGTITTRDSLLPFLIHLEGYFGLIWKLLPHSFSLLGFLCGWLPRQEVKEKILAAFFDGKKIDELRTLGAEYAKAKLLRLVRPEAIERIQWHIEQGHRCILVSASLDIYLAPWAEAMGFSDLLCSKLQEDEEGRVTGRLIGSNCWGPEKVCRIREVLPDFENYKVYAYGDSRGDKEMLASADYPFFKEMPKPPRLCGKKND
jgi:phosphatidylglycerophosphatase C